MILVQLFFENLDIYVKPENMIWKTLAIHCFSDGFVIETVRLLR